MKNTNPKKDPRTIALLKAIYIIGGSGRGAKSEFARVIGRSRQNLNYWLNTPGSLPKDVCQYLFEITKFKVHPVSLRPDIFESGLTK